MLSDMNQGHCDPGVIVRNGIVLVFGSNYGPGEQLCEGSKVTSSRWEILPQMRKRRSGFTPAAWQKAIYLCGGLDNSTVEVFDGVSMKLLALTLPEDSGSMACVKGDTLLIFTAHYLVILSKSGDQFNGVANERRGTCYMNTLPVLRNDVVYSLWGGEVYRYSAQTGHRLI